MLVVGAVFVFLGLSALTLRILFVNWGILYGTSAVSHVDAIVGALLAIGIAWIAWGLTRAKAKSAAVKNKKGNGVPIDGKTSAGQGAGDNSKNPAQRWTDWASGITALVGLAALAVSLMNLLEPLNPPSLAMAACPGTRERNVPYVGITGSSGVNTRAGPARSYPTNGHFPDSCSVGFSAYCIGDPIEDDIGSTHDETWMTSRWLVVAKQPRGLQSDVARLLSGENPHPQFVSDAFVTAETSYDQLPLGAPGQCPGGFPYPAKTFLRHFSVQKGTSGETFFAKAEYAANIGFAVWVPPGDGFLDGGSYFQIATPGAGPANNPGATAPDGSKSIEWDYEDELLSQFKPSSSHKARSRLGRVVVLAVACLADDIPARPGTAAIVGYRLSENGPPVATATYRHGFVTTRLTRAACESGG